MSIPHLALSASPNLYRLLPAFLLLLSSLEAPAQEVSLGFDACPRLVLGERGARTTFDVFALLTTTGNTEPEGAQGWSLSLTAEGGTIKGISVQGVEVSAIYDDDGLPETPPLDPHTFDLGQAPYRFSQLAAHPLDARAGAISAVVLTQERLLALQPNGTARLARITVEAEVPSGDSTAAVTLRFEDGFQGTGQPVRNRIVFQGTNRIPTLGSCTVLVRPAPRAALSLEGCPESLTGRPGQEVGFEVLAVLSVEGNLGLEGASAWSLGLAAEGGAIAAVSVHGLTVPSFRDEDGLPGTPPAGPAPLDLADAESKASGLAVRPADGRAGAVSSVALRLDGRTSLEPSGAARIARFAVTATIPATESPLVLRFEDGLELAGSAVVNRALFEGAAVRPALGSCTVQLIPAPPLQLPGDCNQDAEIDLSDGICLLGYLFSGVVPALPCGDGTGEDPANRLLFDSNGDADLDLSDAVRIFLFLFVGGDPHVLGESCVPAPGCPDQGSCAG